MRAARSLSFWALAVAACGPGEPAKSAEAGREPRPSGAAEPSAPSEPARGGAARRASSSAGIEVGGEVGGLAEDAVDAIVRSASDEIDACWERGAEQNEWLAGSIQLVLGIGGDGRPAYAFVRKSTLGDARAERCMLAALSRKTWPKPVGGKVGVVRSSFSFELPKGARAPAEWTSARVSESLATVADALAACKRGAPGTFTATVYVKQVELPPPPEDAGADAGEGGDAGPSFAGAAISVGVASSDEAGSERAGAVASECLERVLARATYPAPGDWPAKVSFEP